MYNTERYVKGCIDSILAQTFQDFEILVVDDCSTDDSLNVVVKNYNKNKKVRIFSQNTNSGPGAARNLALKHARGKYVYFVDSDDAVTPDALEILHNAIVAEGGVDAIHIKGWYIAKQDDDLRLIISQKKPHFEGNPTVGLLPENIYERLKKNWAEIRMAGYTWGMVLNREFWSKKHFCFPTDCLTEDQVVLLRALCLAKKFLMLREGLYIYRVRGDSTSHAANINLHIRSILIVAKAMAQVLNTVPILDGKRIFKQQCMAKTLEVLFNGVRPAYKDYLTPELDREVREVLSPIFGKNTEPMKDLFHEYNLLWWQAKQQRLPTESKVFFNNRFRPRYKEGLTAELDKEVYDLFLPIFGENTDLVIYLFHNYNLMWWKTNSFDFNVAEPPTVANLQIELQELK